MALEVSAAIVIKWELDCCNSPPMPESILFACLKSPLILLNKPLDCPTSPTKKDKLELVCLDSSLIIPRKPPALSIPALI